jgi:TPR repeat protein
MICAAVIFSEPSQSQPMQCDQLAGIRDDGTGTPFEQIVPDQAESACRSALQSEPTNPRYMFQLAWALDAGKKATEAVQYYEQAASRGYARAMTLLGIKYRYGEGVQ